MILIITPTPHLYIFSAAVEGVINDPWSVIGFIPSNTLLTCQRRLSSEITTFACRRSPKGALEEAV